MQLACAWCGISFEALRRRECCCRSHAAKLARSRRTDVAPPWEAEAEFWLEQAAGTLPLADLAKRFNLMAKRRGWQCRTQESVKIKLGRMGLSRKCTEDNMSRYEISRALGIHVDRVRLWTRKGMPTRKVARNQMAVKVADLRDFLLAHPELATGIPDRELGWLIGQNAAAAIAGAEHSKRGYPRPVLCVDTGERFPGVKAAARAKFVTHGCIGQAIRRGGKSAGCRWRYLDDVV